MKLLEIRLPFGTVRDLLVMLCSALLVSGDPALYAQPSTQQAAPQEQAAPKIPNDQLDSLVAPVALYPDPLLAQVLAASTYPLEIVQLQQWLQQHKDLKDKALVDAVQKQDWDPSVQAMAALPDAVKQLAENIKWTTDLGNAFLAQQSDVMEAVQRMRAKAEAAGNLKSTEQQTVETKVVESKTVVIIQQANPEVVYVPSYNPVVVYGAPVYPYPPIVYPPPAHYAAGAAIAFGVGVAIGAAWHGGWGYGCGWGGNNVNVNFNNNYVNHYNNVNNVNRNNVNRGGNNNWQHNPQHRGAAPYSNKATANKYGGTARGDSMSNRQAKARQNQGQMGGRQQAGTMDRGGGNRQQAGTMDRGGGNRQQASTMNRGGGSGGGGDRVGNRQVPNSPSGSNRSAFGGASSGTSGGAARSSSQRGSSSMSGGSRSGGASRSGGGGRR
jgi:hypothetical protein